MMTLQLLLLIGERGYGFVLRNFPKGELCRMSMSCFIV
jgi:hypothetical protein